MTSVLILSTPDDGAPPLADDFAAAGFHVLGTGDCAHLVREALRHAPDLLVCWAQRPAADVLQAVATLQAQQAMPVLFFTQDSDVERMEGALAAGVHAWVVQGYAAQRLRPLAHLAIARERHERKLRESVEVLGEKLEERKWVDRAKGILMRSQQVSEEEAFQLLRTASMQGNRKVGQLSKQVIEAAHVAEAINRAGQQRMLSQRLVKLYALACSRTDGAAAALLMKASAERIEENLKLLEAGLSKATYGDLVAQARTGWLSLQALLDETPHAGGLPEIDRRAEAVLSQADALVRALESSGLAAQVQVINVSGRQRMQSQRAAKLALLQAMGSGTDLEPQLAQAITAFEQGLGVLARAPLSTPQIRETLARGEAAWQDLRAAIPHASQPAVRMKLAAASEELLHIFDRLTEAYQHSVQVLVG